MASSSLQQQIASMRQSFFDEGIINRDRFIQLENMPNSDFVNIAIKAYFKDSPKAINDIENALIGASKVITEINKIKFCCYDNDMERSRVALAMMQLEYITLKSKLEAYLELLRQAAPASTPIFLSNTNPPGQGSANGND
ncbi:pseudo histidine-containing phosphotransfer protein 5-like [Quercus robur]|uniref:pseudo histidine-containing phosphotransfer protein 5-like n=1 Tax=Quercus robur TaxID=38942 RepID=UPI002162881E|nr:pseudo histidine-containing phosphotransfer protein 5-like [Quercus robur]